MPLLFCIFFVKKFLEKKEKIISSVDNVEMETELTITLKDGVISAYPEEKNKNNTKNITELDNIEKILK